MSGEAVEKDRAGGAQASSNPAIGDKAAAPATVARLVTDRRRGQSLADLLAEQMDASAIALYEDGAQWCVEIHFADPPDQVAFRTRLSGLAGEETAQAFRFETVAARDWVAASLAGLQPVRAGRFVVHGAHDRARIPRNRIAIEIEASLAFGTGHHGTTRGCLLALDRLVKAEAGCRRRPRLSRQARRSVALDIGTGSGVLAIAAAKTMRGGVLGSDLDPAAVRVARENTRRNGVCEFVEVIQATGLAASRFKARGPYPLVFANILLEPLKRLAAGVARLLAPGGRVVLSGLLPTHANAALAIYRSHGLRLVQRIVLDGWITLILTRPPRGRLPPPARNLGVSRRS
ncbi:MAG: 50S ribosomal protein L11 methyltransferase, partial [Rhodoplanes sp.]